MGLLCGEDEREALAYLLCRAGAVRICDGGSMSKLHTPGAHDGEYPLRRYRRIITKG
ncbi:MAG: acyl-CoA reductase [Hungatella hathewayi]